MTRDRIVLRVSVLAAASAAVLLTAGCGDDAPAYRPWSETSTKAAATTTTKTSATKTTTIAPAPAADVPDPALNQAPPAGGNAQVVAPTTTTAAPVVTTTTTTTATTTTTTTADTTTTTTQPVGQQLTQEICSAATSPAIKAACVAGGFTVTP